MLIVNGAGRTREIVDLIHLDIERESNIVAQCLEAWVIVKMFEISLRTSKVVINTDNIVPFAE